MGRTPIQWVERNGEPGFSINPIRFRNRATGKVGHYCEKISPGCKFCYADAMQTGPYLSGLAYLPENREKGELFLDRGALEQVLRRRKPTAYFWLDMTDLFGHWVPFEWIDEIISTMVAAPQHRHMMLTKRPERALEYSQSAPARGVFHCKPDIWIGVSVEDRERKSRLATLRAIPAYHRFVSFEPLLEDLELVPEDLAGIDLAIWGGESGGKARPCAIQWIREGMAAGKRAGSMNFVKQLGRRPVDRNDAGFEGGPGEWPDGTRYAELSTIHPGALVQIKLDDKKGGTMGEWPEPLRVRELPR